MKKKSNFGNGWNTVYSGTAEFGKDYTIVQTVIACIFSFFILLLGITLTFRKPEYTLPSTMVMNKSTGPDQVGSYSNSGTIKSGQCAGNILNVTGSGMNQFSQGQTEQVFLKPGSCDDAELHEDNTKWLGILFIIVSLIILVFSLIKLFFVKKYKGVAATAGVFDFFNFFK